MVWIIHPCWPEQARWLLKVLRVDLKSPKGLHQGGGFDCTGLALGWCCAAVPGFHTHSLGRFLRLAGSGRWVPQG